PSKPGGGKSPSPGTSTPPTTKPPTTKPPTPTPAPTPSETFGSLEDAGTGTLTATAGEAFGERVTVRAKNKLGKPLARTSVTFAVVGATDARFADGKSTVTLRTGADGTVTAPVLTAGEKTGVFKVTAVAGTTKPRALSWTANVTARVADTIALTGDKALTAAPGAEFTDRVEVRTTYKGTGVADTAVTATMITDAGTPAENDKGPYFEDAAGDPVRTLNLTTGADGVLELPEIYADDTEGTYTLRLTTASGATVTVELKVEAAPAA
ncbi:lytic transglycosylase, partial [Mesorhizobium sp. B2-3-3]